MRARLAVNERQFRIITYVALAALTVIVFTGAAVRLRIQGSAARPGRAATATSIRRSRLHPLIEFGNRALSGFVGLITIVVAVLAFTRKPFRKDLAWLALALPLGVVCQAVLGGFTVREKLAPGFVMSHFLLSMVILIFAVWLAWNATHEPAASAQQPTACWSGRFACWPLYALTLAAGTMATAAGPHSGGTRRSAHQAPHVQGCRHARVGGQPARDDRRDLRRAHDPRVDAEAQAASVSWIRSNR
jgi:cytochrome c oxidase assembly protein subunit 15